MKIKPLMTVGLLLGSSLPPVAGGEPRPKSAAGDQHATELATGLGKSSVEQRYGRVFHDRIFDKPCEGIRRVAEQHPRHPTGQHHRGADRK